MCPRKVSISEGRGQDLARIHAGDKERCEGMSTSFVK